MFADAVVAIDGSKFKAVNSKDNKTADDKPIEEKITALKQTLTELKALEAQVNNDPSAASVNKLRKHQAIRQSLLLPTKAILVALI